MTQKWFCSEFMGCSAESPIPRDLPVAEQVKLALLKLMENRFKRLFGFFQVRKFHPPKAGDPLTQ